MKNKAGEECRVLYIKFLQRSFWEMLEEIKHLSGKRTDADAVRWALQRATRRV
jgi:hypothetical protein